MQAIIGNNFAPGYGDHYLARYGYDAQMVDEPEAPGRPDNLWSPLPGDAGLPNSVAGPETGDCAGL